jgi:hypothetical protein
MNETIGPNNAIGAGTFARTPIVKPSHDPFERLGEGLKPLV